MSRNRITLGGCGCLALLFALILGFPLLLGGGASGTAASTAGSIGNVVSPSDTGTARATALRPMFPWTPSGGFDTGSWAWGQCTWFVIYQGRSRGDHQVHWSGDAWQWTTEARNAGFPVMPRLTTPQVGWIAVYDRGPGAAAWGHVAVVVAVDRNTYTLAESNWIGLGAVDIRTLELPPPASLEGWIP